MSLKSRIKKKVREGYEAGKRIVRASKPLLTSLSPLGGLGALSSLGGGRSYERAEAARQLSRQIKKQAGGGMLDYQETYWE